MSIRPKFERLFLLCTAGAVFLVLVSVAILAMTPAGRADRAARFADDARRDRLERQAALKIRDEADVDDPNHLYTPHVRALYVGHSYPVEEGMTDEEWAKSLMLSRFAYNRSGIEAAYSQTSYRHFDNPQPMCKVIEQDHRGSNDPVTCVMNDGEYAGDTIYATSIATGLP